MTIEILALSMAEDNVIFRYIHLRRIDYSVFELQELKAKIKGDFSRSYCCYGNLLCYKINCNILGSVQADFWSKSKQLLNFRNTIVI